MYSQFIALFVLLIKLNMMDSASSGIASHYGDSSDGNTCGNPDPPTDYVATGADLWNYGYQCGACYKITCTGSAQGDNCGCTDEPTVTVQLINRCSECRNTVNYDFDMKTSTKNKISTCDLTEIEYERVDCPFYENENIKIKNKSGSTKWWFALHAYNIAGRGALNGIEIISAGGTWYSCSFKDENYWLCNDGNAILDDTPYDVKFIDDEGTELLAYDVLSSLDGDTVTDTGVQF